MGWSSHLSCHYPRPGENSKLRSCRLELSELGMAQAEASTVVKPTREEEESSGIEEMKD